MQEKLAKLFLSAIAILVLATIQPLRAQQPNEARKLAQPLGGIDEYEDTQLSQDQDIQLLKSNTRSQKKQIVAANMDLTDAEAEKFWPVYDRYATDLSKIYDTKIALLQEYLENRDTMSGDQAESYLRRRAAVEQEQMELRLKYLPEFRKVLTGREAALFYQIEWRLELMINLQLAQAPMINLSRSCWPSTGRDGTCVSVIQGGRVTELAVQFIAGRKTACHEERKCDA
jgi:Spy/CpxP family protein refolding chaperone